MQNVADPYHPRPRRFANRHTNYRPQPAIIHQDHFSIKSRPRVPLGHIFNNNQAAVYSHGYPSPPPSSCGYPSPPSTPVYNGCAPAQDARYLRHQQQQYHHYPTPPSSPPPAVFEPQQHAQFLDPTRRLQYERTLGSGAYGVVHRARDVLTGMQYAVKSLNKFTSDGFPLDARQKQFQRTEMQLHYEVSAHPNIVSLLRILDLQDCTLVVMDYCPEGDLFQNITEQGRYVGNDEEAKAIFLQILDAVAHCHGLGVYHRDLKPENILVSDEGRQVKLADFGLATRDERSSDFGCGSTFYMSPECQNQASGSSYACAPNDIWSLGVILVNLTCGRNPWKAATTKDSTFRAYMEDRQFLKSILPLSDQLNEILGMIFELDPTKRISLEELRQRIIECPAFTKKVVDEDLEVFSRSSSVSDGSSSEDSDMSVFDEEATPGFSRSSTVSEGSTASDCSEDSDMSDDVDVQIMDEETNTNDHQPAIKEEPKLLSSSYCTIEPSHVAEAPSPVDTTGMENLHIIQSVEPTPAPKVSSWQRNSFLNFAAARRQFHRSVTPAQATLLSSFCGQRKSPLQRVF